MTSLSSTEQGVLSLPNLVEVKGQKAKEGGAARACPYQVGLVAMATGWILDYWKDSREGTGRAGGIVACGPRRGCLTQPWEPAGAQVPSQGRRGGWPQEERRCQGHARQQTEEGACPGKLAGAEGPQGPGAQQLRERPSLPGFHRKGICPLPARGSRELAWNLPPGRRR